MADELVESASDNSTSIEDGEKADREYDKNKPGKLGLILGKKTALSLSSADSCSSIEGESLLEELLGDIRRSRTASLASTPTFVSSDYETDVRDCGRSEAELRGMGKNFTVALRCMSILLDMLFRRGSVAGCVREHGARGGHCQQAISAAPSRER